MTHRTFRSLDEPPKLVGFSARQWAALITGALVLLALVHLAALPSKAAITLAVFALGLPAALTYVSESGGLRIGALLRDALTWCLTAKQLLADTGQADVSSGLLVSGKRGGGRPRGAAPGVSRRSERARP